MDVNKIKELYESGMSAAQVGKELNLTPSFVYTTLKNNGVKTRTKKEALAKYAKYDNCIICGERFRVRANWKHGNHYRKTCKPECEKIYKSKRITETWTEERKEYYSEIFTGRDTSGWNIKHLEENPNWKGGGHWNTYSQIVFDINGFEQKCEICGTTENVCVHHKDHNRKNNTPENINIFCKSCHTTFHVKNGDCGGWKELRKNYVPRITITEIKEELSLGKSIRYICEKYKTSSLTIYKLLKENDIINPRKNPNKNPYKNIYHDRWVG